MGSASITDTYWTTDTATVAYDRAVEETRYEYGSRYDTGEICSTSGFNVFDGGRVLSTVEANGLVDGILEKTGKWTPLVAIALEQPGEERDETVTITVRDLSDESIEAAVRKAVKVRKGESITRWWKLHAYGPNPQTTNIMRAPVVTVPKAKAVTRYFINDTQRRQLLGDTAGYASQAEARAAAVELAKSGNILAPMTISARVVRETGEPLLTIEPVLASSTFEMRVSIIGPSPKPGVRAGWMFVGWAAS